MGLEIVPCNWGFAQIVFLDKVPHGEIGQVSDVIELSFDINSPSSLFKNKESVSMEACSFWWAWAKVSQLHFPVPKFISRNIHHQPMEEGAVDWVGTT